jgi:hypothetical protein
MMSSGGAGLNFCGCLDCAGIRVAASKTGHESRLGGSGLDHIIASGMHIDCLLRSCV